MNQDQPRSPAGDRRITRMLPSIRGPLTRHEVVLLAALILYGALVVVVSAQLLLLVPLLGVVWMLHAPPAPDVEFDLHAGGRAPERARRVDAASDRPRIQPKEVHAHADAGRRGTATGTGAIAREGRNAEGRQASLVEGVA